MMVSHPFFISILDGLSLHFIGLGLNQQQKVSCFFRYEKEIHERFVHFKSQHCWKNIETKLQVRTFPEFGTASLRGFSV